MIIYQYLKQVNFKMIRCADGKLDSVFSDDIKTNKMKIYYADESSCKDKTDLIQIVFLP